MKKVLVFGITENPGGVESVIMNYYRNIDRNEIQFDFLCNTEVVAYEEEIKSLGGVIYRVTARSKDRKKFKSDMNNFFLQHAEEYQTIWVNVCSLANIDYLKYAKKYGIKKRIIHAHNSKNMDNFFRGLLHKWNRMFITKYATDFWSCSDEASRWFYNKKIINSNKYLLVNNAIDCDKYKFNQKVRDKYRKELGIDDKTLVIGNVGRMHFQKNHPFIIKVFKEVHKAVPNSVLLLVGDGPDRVQIEDIVQKDCLRGCIKFLGTRNDTNNLLQAMDIFLFPSIFEGLPLALVEAQASNLMIYASNVISNKIIVDEKLIKFISLDKDEIFWANQILRCKFIDRNTNDIEELLKEKGFDIRVEANKIEKKLKGE